MIKVKDDIIIEASGDIVFDLVNDYENWPNILTVNKKVTFLKEENGKKHYEVSHLRNKNKLIRSVCIREMVNNRHIKFELGNPKFKILIGEWIIEEAGNKKVKLVSIHYFELNIPFLPVFLKDLIGYILVKKMFFDRTTPKTLKELKVIAEKICAGKR